MAVISRDTSGVVIQFPPIPAAGPTALVWSRTATGLSADYTCLLPDIQRPSRSSVKPVDTRQTRQEIVGQTGVVWQFMTRPLCTNVLCSGLVWR